MADTKNFSNMKRIIGAIVGIILGVIVARTPPPTADLTAESMIGLGVFLGIIVWWATEVFPDYITALIMCLAWAGFKAVPFGTAFSGFSNSNIWLMVGAFGLAAVVAKCGLLNRISLYLMSLFPFTYKGQTLALMLTGTAITPLIPSASAKIAVVAPIASDISKKIGFDNKSKGAGGLFASMYLSLGTIHPLFLTGSFMCYATVGLIPKEMQGEFTWMKWFITALPWGVTLFILGYLAILLLYRPEKVAGYSPEEGKQMIREKRQALGSMSKQEKLVAVVLTVTLLLWMTARIHGIDSGVIGLLALCVLMGANLMDRSSFRAGITWDAVVFVGCIYTVSGVFSALKLNGWIGSLISPYLMPLIQGNIFIFLIVLCILIYLVRFVLASQLATMTIVTVALTPLALQAGIHPIIIAFTSFVAINVWIFIYQNLQYIVAFYAADGGEMTTHQQNVKLSLAYMVVSMIGILVSVPFWMLLGYIQ